MKEMKSPARFNWEKLPFLQQSTKASLLILSLHTCCFCRFWWRHSFLNSNSSNSSEWGWKPLFHLTHFWTLASMSLIFVWDLNLPNRHLEQWRVSDLTATCLSLAQAHQHLLQWIKHNNFSSSTAQQQLKAPSPKTEPILSSCIFHMT